MKPEKKWHIANDKNMFRKKAVRKRIYLQNVEKQSVICRATTAVKN